MISLPSCADLCLFLCINVQHIPHFSGAKSKLGCYSKFDLFGFNIAFDQLQI